MAAISKFLFNTLVDFVFRQGSYTPSTTLYIGICTVTPVSGDSGTQVYSGSGGTGVEVTGGSYARVAYNPSSSSNWTATQGGVSGASSGSTGLTSNNTTITFPTATASWGTIVGMAIFDAATNGNMLFFGALSASKVVGSGDVFDFNANQLSVTLS